MHLHFAAQAVVAQLAQAQTATHQVAMVVQASPSGRRHMRAAAVVVRSMPRLEAEQAAAGMAASIPTPQEAQEPRIRAVAVGAQELRRAARLLVVQADRASLSFGMQVTQRACPTRGR
jgi:hypothetical protein